MTGESGVPIIVGTVTRSEALRRFGTQIELARALGITQASVAGWGENIPRLRQIQIEVITDGELQADASCWPPANNKEEALPLTI